MANQDHVNIISGGSTSIAEWRKDNPYIKLDLIRADLRGINFSNANLSNVNFSLANLEGAKFRSTNLKNAVFLKTNLKEVDFTDSDLSESSFSYSDCENVHFSGVNLFNTRFINCNLTGILLEKTSMEEACFIDVNLNNIIFTGLQMREITFSKCDLNFADFSEAYLYKASFLDCDLNRAQFNKARLFKVLFTDSILSGVIFSGSNLTLANLTKCALNYSIFDGALLYNTEMEETNLYRASFIDAQLTKTNLSKAYLVEANFSGATIKDVNFDFSDLNSIDFTGAQINVDKQNPAEPGITMGFNEGLLMTKNQAMLDSNNPFLPKVPEKPNYVVIKVYYGTDRNSIQQQNDKISYGSERDELTMGYCELSIPRDHRMASLEGPSMLRLQFREYPDKHIVLLNVKPETKHQLLIDLKNRISYSETNQVFIFIHGFNVSFEEAARRTAQIHYDLTFDGAPIFYSWPSEASVVDYTVDEATIERAERHLEDFLKMVILQTVATQL